MRFASLGSGSKGNGTLVETAETCVLVDCGFTVKDTVRRLERLGKVPGDIDAILVTHEHSDHIKGVPAFASKFNIEVYASYGTASYKSLYEKPFFRQIQLNTPFNIGQLHVSPIAVPHDAREPCQYVFSKGEKSFGLLTDLGSITPLVLAEYQQCDALFLECNHDVQMLADGPYPYSLKRRVGGDWGHLSNVQAAEVLSAVKLEKLQHVVLAHLSEKNNTQELALSALSDVLGGRDVLVSADQEQGLDWLVLH
jgi:phosphoribosyl 1,2-cyclic phosphodiesterase